MTAVRYAEVRDLASVIEGLERAGWNSYGKIAAEVMGDVPAEVINAAAQSGLEYLAEQKIRPAVFGVTTRITKGGFGGITMVMWCAAAPPGEDE